ncbi:MAG: glycosyltransferase [Acidobacteriota bacterium]|nr:glycosyltransferase [Acidobacteriota bacterium]
MCGINGIAFSSKSRRKINGRVLAQMRDVIAHRGPDDWGEFIDENIGLGHRRLSIVDVAHGHQPMFNEDKSCVIIYNGEVYNHADYRAELTAKGYKFKTACDTETILHLYEEYGAKCVEKLRGMFAFAIWNGREQSLFIARDRLGVKPLYYVHDAQGNLFKKADLVIVSAEKLLENKKHFNENTFIIRHGVDFSHFRKALDAATEIPEEIKDLPRPIIGFHGLLADWVDFELIKKAAEHFAKGSIVLIGKIAVDAEKKVKILSDVKNVHFLGRKPYAELPAFCKGFDVALNPFAINDLTLAANPLKVREYLAAGLPVISTDIPEVKILEHCRIGRTSEDFIRQIEEALKKSSPQKTISDSVENGSWEARVDELREIMAKSEKVKK